MLELAASKAADPPAFGHPGKALTLILTLTLTLTGKALTASSKSFEKLYPGLAGPTMILNLPFILQARNPDPCPYP